MYAQSIWQWSVPVNSISSETNSHPQAYLWIPENCKQIRGVVFTQNNMIELGMLEHAYFRKKMAALGFAEVWVNPMYSITFDFNKNDATIFEDIMQDLADVSGYDELATAPIVPMGHSALASFPWNFGAENPERTLAIVSVHGDAPQTNLTGSGRPNPDWENRNIDGIPALFIMGEYEWWEDRIAPAYQYMSKHPNSVITLFADAGHGHFDFSDMLVKYVADYIEKAASYRLPKNIKEPLKQIKPEHGWLMDKWRQDSLPQAKASPYTKFKGNRYTASWVFDKEMVKSTVLFYEKARNKQQQFIGFKQHGNVLQPIKNHANYQLEFKPLEDGISFHLNAFFSDSTKVKPVNEHAKTSIKIDKITGPIKKINDTTFQISFDRLGFNNSKRSNDIWLLAHNEGDENYKSAVQQLNLRFPLANTIGKPQVIDFQEIKNQEVGVKSLKLNAKSSTGSSVNFYVKEGPAYCIDDQLYFTEIPPKAKFPIKITVVAWQYGIVGDIQTANPVEQIFFLTEHKYD